MKRPAADWKRVSPLGIGNGERVRRDSSPLNGAAECVKTEWKCALSARGFISSRSSNSGRFRTACFRGDGSIVPLQIEMGLKWHRLYFWTA